MRDAVEHHGHESVEGVVVESGKPNRSGRAAITLITGATGFIGGRLLRPGERALVRRPASLENEVIGALDDQASLARACEGVTTVYHCAGYAHAFTTSDPEVHWRVNFEGARNLVTAAGEAGVRRFVFLSSVKAMAEPGEECVDEDWPGEPVSPYGKAKRAAEDAVLEAGAKYGMHVVNLRLAMVYGHGGRGNLERMVRVIRAGWFPQLPETGNRRSLVHVQDVVEVMRLVAERPEANGRTYIVADPRAYSGREIYDAIYANTRAVLRKPTLRWSVPAGVLRAAGCLNSRLNETVERLLGSACYSPARIERELGWRTKVELEVGLREMLGGASSVLK